MSARAVATLAVVNNYQALKVEPTAPVETIKRAYRAAARASHPDLHPGDPHAVRRFRAASEAWRVLSDERERRNHDAMISRPFAVGVSVGDVAATLDDLAERAMVTGADATGQIGSVVVRVRVNGAEIDGVAVMRAGVLPTLPAPAQPPAQVRIVAHVVFGRRNKIERILSDHPRFPVRYRITRGRA